MTGARVVPTVASQGKGISEVRAALTAAIAERDIPPVPAIAQSAMLQADIAELEGLILQERLLSEPREARAWAQWLLLSLDHDNRR